MSAKVPYLSTPGTITTVLNRIKAAATPPTFNNDFVEAKLQVKGGAGRAIPPFMKKIGFVAGDGTPTAIYHRFRNAATSGAAVADSLKVGYKPLYEIHEYVHELNDAQLKGVVVQATGLEEDNRVIELCISTFKKLKAFANFEAVPEDSPTTELSEETTQLPPQTLVHSHGSGIGFNIGYTINLNLPASTNVEVFNAIFKSLKENLLRG